MRQLWQHFDYGLTDLQFDECGIQQFEPYQVYQYTVYQPYIIHWIASGKGSLEVDNHCYPLTANQGFILRRGQQVKYYAMARSLGATIGLALVANVWKISCNLPS